MSKLSAAYKLISNINTEYGHKGDIYRYVDTTNSLGQIIHTSLSKIYSNVSLSYKARRFPPKDVTEMGSEYKNFFDASINNITDEGAEVILQDGDKVIIDGVTYDIIKPKLEPFGYLALLVRQE
jgi:signal peptidase I